MSVLIIDLHHLSRNLMDQKSQKKLFFFICSDIQTQIPSILPASLFIKMSHEEILTEPGILFPKIITFVVYVGIGFIISQK